MSTTDIQYCRKLFAYTNIEGEIMENTMWALVKDKPEEGLTMKRVEIPKVGHGEVKIKIHKTAICGTDVHIWLWNEWARETIKLGTTAGHEYVGEIVEAGDGVENEVNPFC